MESFFKFWDRIQSDKNQDTTTNFDTSGYELKPLTPEDMSQASEDDVNAWRAKHGKNTTKLGDNMTDAEFQRFHGLN